MRNLRHSFILLAFAWAPAFGAEPANDLARVGIVKFINNTGSEDFGWVEQSLPDAIDTSMKARFEYQRLEEDKVQSAASQVKPGPTGYSREDAEKISTLSQADILIYGNFYPDAEADELVLDAIIYNAAGKRVIGRVENRTPLNAKIFKNIDQMAAGIVAEIYRFALQANQDSGKKSKLKLLVLVPSYSTSEEEAQAKQELEVLKVELQAKTPGRYLTIFEFFDEYHVVEKEQQSALGYAKRRERTQLQLWLENYGVTNAMIVLVTENKVNITAIGAAKSAQVSYAVNASPEERAKQLAAVEEKVRAKVEIRKDAGGGNVALHWGAAVSKGFLASGDRLGVMTGLNIHASWRIHRYFEPHLQVEAYYGFKKENVSQMLGGSAMAGLGYTFSSGKFAVQPYALGGIFAAEIKAAAGVFNVLLPAAGSGLIVSYFVSPSWGFTLNTHAQYVIDSSSPALFAGATLATVVRF